MIADYSAFGLSIRSNVPIPGLALRAPSAISPDLEVFLGGAPSEAANTPAGDSNLVHVSSITTEAGEAAFKVWRTPTGLLRMDYFDGIQFWLDPGGARVWAAWPEPLLIEDAATYLLGPVLGWLLRLRGVTCLHASAVAFGEFAAAFVGCAGAGKSTTAAALAGRGHPAVSDDIVALVEREGEFKAQPAYPYLCLWQESVELLYGSAKVLPAFSPSWEKRQLRLAENRLAFEERPLPVGAIFLLGERSDEAAAPFLEEVAPKEALLALVGDSYATNFLDIQARKKEFKLLGRLVNRVPVRRLRPHREGGRIGELCELIEKECRGVSMRYSRS